MLDGSNDVDSRKGVIFGGLVDIAAIYGINLPKNPFWGARICVFQPNAPIIEMFIL